MEIKDDTISLYLCYYFFQQKNIYIIYTYHNKGGEFVLGNLIQDKTFLNDNIFLFEKRLESQYTIFFDNKTPTFVTYYHINNINSITDTGLLNVDNIIGSQSPIRFQRIDNFPLYGIDSIKPDLSDEEQGLDSSFDGDAIVLPNTIKPLPNDIFTISYLGESFVFMVTDVNYDTIKSNNFYSINYTMRSEDDVSQVERLVLEKYNCIFQNIGTDDKCLIRSDEYDKIKELSSWCTKHATDYMSLFYNSRYNSMLFQSGSVSIYDRYLTHFINNNSIFNVADSYNTLYMSNEDYDNTFTTEYEDCIYRKLEENDMSDLNFIRTFHWAIAYPDSIFRFFNVRYVRSIRFNDTGDIMYVPDELIANIRNNTIVDNNVLGNILINYFNNNYKSIHDIDLVTLKKYKIRHRFEDFIMFPMALYCVKRIMKNNMKGSEI